MTRLHNTIAIAASPDAVWRLVGDLAAVPQWVPGIVDARIDGERRICTAADGSEIHETISDYAAAERSYRYAHTRSPMPVRNSRGRFAVEAKGRGARVVWDAEFEALDPGQEKQIAAMLDGAFKETLESLRRRVEDAAAA